MSVSISNATIRGSIFISLKVNIHKLVTIHIFHLFFKVTIHRIAYISMKVAIRKLASFSLKATIHELVSIALKATIHKLVSISLNASNHKLASILLKAIIHKLVYIFSVFLSMSCFDYHYFLMFVFFLNIFWETKAFFLSDFRTGYLTVTLYHVDNQA